MRQEKKLANIKMEINGHQINRVNQFKYLGNIITNNGCCTINSELRINKTTKASFALSTIGWQNWKMTTNIKSFLYNTFCRPTLLYSAEINSYSKTQTVKMQQVEGTTIKRALGLSKYASTSKILNALGIINLDAALKQSKVRFFGQLIKNQMAMMLLMDQIENPGNLHHNSFLLSFLSILQITVSNIETLDLLKERAKSFLLRLEEERQANLLSETSTAIRYLLTNRSSENNTLLLQLVDVHNQIKSI